MTIEMYHNPRCSKSRETLERLQARGIQPSLRLYLDNPPSRQELQQVLQALGLPATALLRTKEAIYKELVEREGTPDDAKAIDWMVKHPILIERPIVIIGNRARLGRPPEQVDEILPG